MTEFFQNKIIPFLAFLYEQAYQYYWVQEWTTYSIVTLVFHILMTITICGCGIAIVKYLKDYQIFQMIALKIAGNMQEYDKIQRKQRAKEAEEREIHVKENDEKNLLDKIYDKIAMTGVVEIIPGFSEAGFLVLAAILGIVILITMFFLRGMIIAVASTATYFVVLGYSLSLVAYNRRVQLESQLMQFVDSVASASIQFSNVIDIFGAIYPNFKAPLRKGLESCYVEAKQTSNKDVALTHLVRKYDSAQFAFIIDNLKLCSQVTGDYRGICKDLGDTVAIYSASHKRKQAILRNSKVQITVMFLMSLGIMYTLGLFLGGITEIIFGSVIGNLCMGALLVLYFYGLNIKAEK